MKETKSPPILTQRAAELNIQFLAITQISPSVIKRFQRMNLANRIDEIDSKYYLEKARLTCNNPVIRFNRRKHNLGIIGSLIHTVKTVAKDLITPSQWKYYNPIWVATKNYKLDIKLGYWDKVADWVDFHYIKMDRTGIRHQQTGQFLYTQDQIKALPINTRIPQRPNRPAIKASKEKVNANV